MKKYHLMVYEIVKQISSFDEKEQAQKADALDWILSGVELCRIEKPATPPKHLVSYSVLFDRGKEKVLLVDHKKAALWLPPGGHVDFDEHPMDTALRELQEECGVGFPFLQKEPFFITVSDTVNTSRSHTDVSLWYIFEADSSVSIGNLADEFYDAQWFPIDDLPKDRVPSTVNRLCNKLQGTYEKVCI